jgi:hypothetical protein
MNKKGQVTLFIILAILIVAAIVAGIILMGGTRVQSPEELNPREFIGKCVRDSVEPAITKVLENGGQVNPTLTKMYLGEEYNFLCYQSDYYLPCFNIHPMLEKISEAEIREDTMDNIQNCFDSLRQDLEAKGFSVSGGSTDYQIDLLPGIVDIKLTKKIQIGGSGGSQSFELFDTQLNSPIYNLIRIAREIVNQEAQYCNFEYNGYMLLYPQYDIKRISYDESKIYKIIDRRSGAMFRFAVRSCAMPPGF